MTQYSADELLPLSALQHLLFCERQCAFIHIEQIWMENRLTVEGDIFHDRVDRQETLRRKDVRTAYGVLISSLSLGLSGRADVVEYHRLGNKKCWQPFPVEYKRGKPKRDLSDMVQLCAQAMCLEEMSNCAIESGALFYGKTRRRQEVDFTQELRGQTETAAARLHELFESRLTPPAKYEKKCSRCSFYDYCKPKMFKKEPSVSNYLRALIND